MGHECFKSSLAFRKPATAVASRRPGRADGLMVGLDGHASLSAGRAPWRDGQAFLPLRRRPEGKVCRRRRQQHAVGTRMRAAYQPIIDRRTQWHALSAAVNNERLTGGYRQQVVPRLRGVHRACSHHPAMTESSSLTTGWWQVFVASHVEPMLKSIAHGAHAMARALRMVGGDHRAPSGPRRPRRSSSLFAELNNMYRE